MPEVSRIRAIGALAALAFAAVVASPASSTGSAGSWPMYAGDVRGTRVSSTERVLSKTSVAGLREQWRYKSPGGAVYGTPAVAGGVVYAADLAGFVFALDAATGAQLWLTRVGTATLYPFQLTASPLVTSTHVIVGDLGGTVYALRRDNGKQEWTQRPNTYGYPAIWGSPSLANVPTGAGDTRDLVLVPVSSNEETYTLTNEQPCCSSRGSIAALDPGSGAVVWQTFMISDAEAAAGASGATIWTQPTYDATLNQVFVSTGNNYGNTDETPTTDTSDAIIALNGTTGAVVWKNQRFPNDTWTLAYPLSPEHPDADFGDSPQLFTSREGTRLVAAGQKNGVMHVLEAKTGRLVAQRQFLPGGGLGGFFADSGVSNGVVIANGNEWASYGGGELGGLAGPVTGSEQPDAGHVVAVRADTGRLQEVWRFTTPRSPMLGAVAIANGVVYVHASKEGGLYALDEATGAVLKRVPVGPAICGPAVVNGRIFLGFGDVSNLAGADPTTGGVVAIGL